MPVYCRRISGLSARMVSISLFIELLRTRPRLLFWTMAALQAVLWTLVPWLFYAAPPGDLPLVLAVGREFQFGSEFGPPLAFWLAELAFRAGGLFAVYLLSQLCIVAAFWAVFALGRLMVGATHAAMAVMLMAGIAIFSVPTPEFGPAVLATPLWALMLYHYWIAQRGDWVYWLTLGAEAGLLLLTSFGGLILIGLIVLHILGTASGRAQLLTVGPWIAGIAFIIVLFPYLVWLDLGTGVSLLDLAAIERNLRSWGALMLALLISHAGMVFLILLGRGSFFGSRAQLPIAVRAAVTREARNYVYFFAVAPALAMGLFALFSRRAENLVAAPLVVMSGLAVIVAAGDRIKIGYQYLIGYVWLAMVALPPLLVALGIAIQPWIFAIDLKVGRPAAAMGRFFGDSFARRTGQPLVVVAGDLQLAALVAVGAPTRPSLLFATAPQDQPRNTRQDNAEKGAVIVWPATDSVGRPPAEILALFPGLVAEVPHAFRRPYQGRMPLLRVGWAMIRPSAQAGASH
jgi:4-amino-4-deoxy-L-arabinose transferase-like glycosyltransferase